MAITLTDWWDSKRWIFQEKGLQRQWNEVKQVLNSKAGSGVTGGTTVLGSIDMTVETGLLGVATTRSGSFGASNGGVAGSATSIIPDPSGHSGVSAIPPTPERITQRTPAAGFRP